MELQTGWEREMRKRGKMSRRNNSEEKKKTQKQRILPNWPGDGVNWMTSAGGVVRTCRPGRAVVKPFYK